MMTINDIRQTFIDFFVQKQHHAVEAAPIVNKEDPSLLFINAGMNPFKAFFLGEKPPLHPRLVNSQPCLRVAGKHNDLEEVGLDTYHHTFFEMLGNWSFGNYFKKEAIAWAWELLTDVFNLPKEQLYVTVFEGDQADGLAADCETYDYWAAFVPKERILYASKKDNFWEMGETGPCGPCTEIHIDMRDEAARKTQKGAELVNKDHPQVIEIWNLVFIQYSRQADHTLKPLPNKHVDTGMGLERLAMVLQGKDATYDTDAFQPLLQWLSKETGYTYGQDQVVDRAMRTIADHLRAVAFAIADGELPGPQKAGYVIRRILRRAVRFGFSQLGFTSPFLYRMVPLLLHLFQGAYPRLHQQAKWVAKAIREEEKSFFHTLSAGMKRLEQVLHSLPPKQDVLPGETLFELYDTYGFPPDLTRLIAQERGVRVNEAGFEQEMKAQKQRAKKASQRQIEDWHIVHPARENSLFVGYDAFKTPTKLVKYRRVQEAEKSFFQLVLAQTPFYAESGGQVGDTGRLCFGEEEILVWDTQKEHSVILHYTDKLPKEPGLDCIAEVDEARRCAIMRNHTATHLLHAALRQVLGKHVEQRGSLVHDQGLRFDFSHPGKITSEEWALIGKLVNEKIRENIPLKEERAMLLEEAKALGAMALFGEKYGEKVRVVIFDPNFSIELCGGTHVDATGKIGMLVCTSEGSIASGIRRIEAITGAEVEQFIKQKQQILQAIGTALRQPQQLVQAVEQLVERNREWQKKWEKAEKKRLNELLGELKEAFVSQGDQYVLIKELPKVDPVHLRALALPLSKVHPEGLVLLVAKGTHQVHVTLSLGASLQERVAANDLLAKLLPYIEGKGGGKKHMAIGIGNKIEGIASMLQKAHELI